ncbi:HoxN/HupN/NixA family nickel/cobalt transporter [Cohnella abietis]|uniref:Nickel/cobalt efflux system n=1 Tax=Cohnella abietis TaxID=2507935 RepID=A0A3T1DB93_9BACL|nr:HoxN/HupN/NixA family nickel/cobalt transporter [Cohnella abietis]BBI35396.1 nickel/cobalt efflux system [Cohnella abietis]
MKIRSNREIKSMWKYAIAVLILHIVAIAMLASSVSLHPTFWGLGLIAYTLGLRHAFDADHIAAIDNTVRKLMQQNRNPLGVGFYFSAGHSSVVFLMVLATALSVHWAQRQLPIFQEVGGVIGASVSGLFLVVVGIVNCAVLLNLIKVRRNYRAGRINDAELVNSLSGRGILSRLTKPLIKLIGRSWHVYPLGFLFGLGFDTASEVALLAISGAAASQVLPISGILALPLLFASGMTLMDTANGFIVVKAYRWALEDPLKKLHYNLVVTFIAVAAALSIGTFGLIETLSTSLDGNGTVQRWIERINLDWLGYGLVIFFVAVWLIYYLLSKKESKLTSL